MRAMLWTAYGPPDVLQLGEVPQPVPKDDELLIRIHAATVTAGDCEIRGLQMPMMLNLPMRLYLGWSKPTKTVILGQELAGQVVAVGANVTKFAPGDKVFAATDFSFGAYAEYICLPEEPEETVLAPMPSNISYEQAAASPMGGLEALHYLDLGHPQANDKILINGAGGSIGTIALQIAKLSGAQVTAVDSGPKLDMLRSLGADHVVDYTQEDFWQNGQTYDVIFDIAGKTPLGRCLRALAPGGRFLMANPRLLAVLRSLWTNWTSNKHVFFNPSQRTLAELLRLRDLLESGKLTPVVGRRFPLEALAEAHRYVEAGHKQGSVVVTIVDESET